jgi:hypothetical protein
MNHKLGKLMVLSKIETEELLTEWCKKTMCLHYFALPLVGENPQVT